MPDPVTLGLVGAAVLGGSTILGNKSPPADTDPGSDVYGGTPTNGGGVYSLAYWQPKVATLLAAEFPDLAAQPGALAAAMAWMRIESGGNPGAIGTPGQLAGGYPAEIGLGQLYNPDDFDAAGVSPADFRAYCVGNGQKLSRNLTDDEEQDQVRYTLLWKMQQGLRRALELGVSWSARDLWCAVKAPHALPSILSRGFPAVVEKLGRAPVSWAEFRQALGMEGNSQWRRALDACEAVGNAAG